MRKLSLIVALGLVTMAVAAAPVSADRGTWNNWHVHDGGTGSTDASGLRHLGVAFFPTIWPDYATDPSLWVYCADGVDKGLVGGDGGAKVAAGPCHNEDHLIHLQVIANGAPAPAGWTALAPSATFSGYTVYYRLTSR